jgi:hypothetical protein
LFTPNENPRLYGDTPGAFFYDEVFLLFLIVFSYAETATETKNGANEKFQQINLCSPEPFSPGLPASSF